MREIFSLEKIVAKVRLYYHASWLDINNTLNQLHLMSNERNERGYAKHAMIVINDICPRLGITEEMILKAFKK
jgi:hypothetical protein